MPLAAAAAKSTVCFGVCRASLTQHTPTVRKNATLAHLHAVQQPRALPPHACAQGTSTCPRSKGSSACHRIPSLIRRPMTNALLAFAGGCVGSEVGEWTTHPDRYRCAYCGSSPATKVGVLFLRKNYSAVSLATGGRSVRPRARVIEGVSGKTGCIYIKFN